MKTGKMEGALRRLYGRVESSGVVGRDRGSGRWGKRPQGRRAGRDASSARVPQVSSRRLRWAVYIPLALLLVAGIAIGTVFAGRKNQS